MSDRPKMKQQAAVDFLVSYGIAILIISISIYVVVRLGIFSSALAQPTCVAAPSFSCGAFAFSHNGLLTVTFTQAVGGTLNITGVSCSSGVNVISNLPQYGNIYVANYIAKPQFYPTTALQYGLLLYSDGASSVTVNCYGAGGISTTGLGTIYTGYVWFNYTYTGLPNSYHTVERVVQFTARST